MARLLTGSFAVAVLGVVALAGAQTRSQGEVKGANTYDPNLTDAVVGCLRPGTMTGTFVIADASVVKDADAGKAVGTAGSGAKTYSLGGIVPPGVRLQDHVNHKVEVAGTITDAADAKSNPIVTMHTFKMVASTCP
jgi:hypothetical protein